MPLFPIPAPKWDTGVRVIFGDGTPVEVLQELAQEAKAHNFDLLLENPNPEKPAM